ncbi:MAG TPA: folylpolyglutamate synthase/dihydrofolate synthase family protein [Vicinamibacteria bacterium]|nr:folylpolyglutamate synthase/dihydrofolate synthase family protein [Vicinamibacteria bacterium]
MRLSEPSAESYLEARARLGIKFGLQTMRALVEALGHPERAFTALTVAGTNGKGSVAAYADSVLRAAGLATGRYTSPHLVRVHERITADGREIGGEDLEEAVGAVRRAAERLVAAGGLHDQPTYFEALTAAALDHFRRKGVRTAVLEVGLGGRLDATNVCDPVASAIVSLDFDHQVYLGTSLAAIAGEKAGVLRQGRVTVLGPMAKEAREAIGVQARAVGARLVDAEDGARLEDGPGGLDVHTPAGVYRALRPLPGAHQRANLLVALRLLEEARAAGVPVDLAAVRDGVAATRWPGRLQDVAGDPPVLLDGAHNAAGARALAGHLVGRGPLVLLFGAMADKDVEDMAGTLFPLARRVVLTRVAMERAAFPEELALRAGDHGREAEWEGDLARAFARARALARPDATLVVAGSLYLVGAVVALLEAEGTSVL